jgi:hypothetical protein
MFPSNPYSKGAVESAVQRLTFQNVRTFRTRPFHRNSRESTCLDSSLTYDQSVQTVENAIAEMNRAF